MGSDGGRSAAGGCDTERRNKVGTETREEAVHHSICNRAQNDAIIARQEKGLDHHQTEPKKKRSTQRSIELNRFGLKTLPALARFRLVG